MRVPAFSASLLLFLPVVVGLNAIQRTGRFLYDTSTGSRFLIKGVAYQPQGTVGDVAPGGFPEPTDFTDPLANSDACKRDLPFLQQLGVNTLRVYSVNASLNHDSCVQMFEGAGIYLLIDLSLPVNGSIDRSSPAWSTNLLDLYLTTIESFSKYTNILGYNVGNEIINSTTATTAAAPFIKAAVRDIKAYIKSKNSTALVGYSSVDGSRDWLIPLANYLSCDNDAVSLDIYGLNNYEWCGDSNINVAYRGLANDFANYNIPAYFSEFGCETQPPRLFTEVAAMFGDVMTPVFSGGIAFSYFPATVPGFALVNISSDGSVVTNDDFQRLKAQYGNVTFTNNPSQSAAGQTSFPSCANPTAAFLASNTLPPTPNEDKCSCVESKSFSCVFNPGPDALEVVGSLLGQACGDIFGAGSNCDTIASNGTSGTYGPLSFCDPDTKLSWAFSEFYEITNRNLQSCNFAGNAIVAPNAPASRSDADSAANSCLAASPSGTFVPSAPAFTAPAATSTSGGSGSSGSGNGSTGDATALLQQMRGNVLPLLLSLCGMVSGAMFIL